ncbi:oxidative damage protection protein [Thiothrix eikelboomii]|uniref:Probable Fe(2+)-trafficking protein n=1 Tax=Thiothrix eikelboomii TaxID=92487 RepID=A0A1T4WGG8_9GAMM|nr:oxidative damage protection protein [Thiothrix eikelboomii]SKA76297.1 Fe-S cluster biosynthesis and repair protein YggX [Thiothrix eikelboomii]
MTRMVNCIVLGREAEGLERLTYPGDLGKRIYETVSKEAWQQWLRQQTILINEYRLSPINPKDRKFLEEEMDKFFFGTGATKIDNYKPV